MSSTFSYQPKVKMCDLLIWLAILTININLIRQIFIKISMEWKVKKLVSLKTIILHIQNMQTDKQTDEKYTINKKLLLFFLCDIKKTHSYKLSFMVFTTCIQKYSLYVGVYKIFVRTTEFLSFFWSHW